MAVADFYPKVTLDGSLGLQALKAKDLGNWAARQYGLGPTISIPIFEGGRLRATLELRKVEQQEAALNYQQTVLQAWHDVDNAMTAYAAEQRRRDALAESVTQNRRALDLSRQRYTQGVADFLNVLDAERDVAAGAAATGREHDDGVFRTWCSFIRRWVVGGSRPIRWWPLDSASARVCKKGWGSALEIIAL